MASLVMSRAPSTLPTSSSVVLASTARGLREGPMKPPSPDMSVLSDAEKQRLMNVLQHLLSESEKEMQRIRHTEDELREALVEAIYPDFYVVCDGCFQIQPCLELPHVAHGGRLLVCADCVVSFLSGTWFNGVKISDTIDVCSQLMELAASSNAGSSNALCAPPEPVNTPSTPPACKLLDLAATTEPVLEEEKDELPVPRQRPRSVDTRRASVDINFAQGESDDEMKLDERSRVASVKFAPNKTENNSTEASESGKNSPGDKEDEDLEKDDTFCQEMSHEVKSAPVPVPRLRSSRNHGNSQNRLSSTSSMDLPISQTSSPALPEVFSEGEDVLSPVNESQNAECLHYLGPGQLTGDEPIGELEIGMRVGVETSSRQSGLIIDILQGYNFKHWSSVSEKANFHIYVKCYLLSGEKVKAKPKTHSVLPCAEPKFFDQLISVMDKKVLEKLDKVKIQVWEDHGPLKKKMAVGTATITLSELSLTDNVVGKYPIFLPRVSGPTMAQTAAESLPPSPFTRSPSGRFDIRSSFRRLGSKRRSSRKKSSMEVQNNTTTTETSTEN